MFPSMREFNFMQRKKMEREGERDEERERMEVDICIVGGGLAGLALALGLQERGIKAHVFERYSVPRPDPGAVTYIGENGIRALEGIRPGLSKTMAEAGIYATRLKSILVRDGKEVSTKITEFAKQTSMSIPWKRAQQTLAAFVDGDLVHSSHRLLYYKPYLDGVEAHFEYVSDKGNSAKHTKIVKAKLLIGADGIWSTVRKLMIGDTPRHLNLVEWSAVVIDPNERIVKGLGMGEICVRFQEDGEIKCILVNAGDCTIWILRMLEKTVQLVDPIPGMHGDSETPSSKSQALQRLCKYKGWEELREIIMETPEELILERKLMDRLPLSSWSDLDGHVLLIGDAAHAQFIGSGQGARTAYEDAHQLSILLEEASHSFFSKESIKSVVRRFEDLRVPRLEKMHWYACHLALLPELKPKWVRKLSNEEVGKWIAEFHSWVNAYPNIQQGDPNSTYCK